MSQSGIDRFGRTLACLRTVEGDVGEILLAEELALPWQPGPAAEAHRLDHC